ncbi:zinc finger protein 282-like isoform X1 [Pongo pygmaeus]|uniref:zinc finger protein 282-like isoform X1 n=2 Tax=Pongo pygmaeus TaxID=9600 RepID=UPI00300CA7F5
MAEAAAPPDWHMQTEFQGEAQILSAESSLLAVMAAVQVVEKKMEPQAAWLQILEGSTRTAKKKLADCEKVAVEFRNQLEASEPCWGPCCRSTGCCRGGWGTWRTCCATGTSGSCGCPRAARGRPPRLGHHQARSSGASGERRQAGNCSLPSTERGQSPGTDAGQLETSPGILSWIKQEEGASGRSQQGPQETTGAHLCSETCPGRKEERSLEGGSEGQEPVWAAGGGPGKEGSGGSTCGGLLPDPREREVASLPPGPPSQAEPAARGTEQCPPCAQCGQSLGQKELSAPHQRAHHGPPPFAGAQCPKSFPQRATPHQPPSGARGRAHLHLRPVRQDLRPPVDAHTHYSAHIGEKPYECAECAKSFGRLSTLLEHWHTHTALSPMKSTRGNHDKFLIR